MRCRPIARIFAAVCGTILLAAGGCTTEAADAHPASRAAPQRSARSVGQSDESIRRILSEGRIEKVTKGSGGRSVAFRLTFAGDVQGYFKPEQRMAAHWFSELASYYLDRELGLKRVPPAIGRRIEWSKLLPYVRKDERLAEVVVRDGFVRGSIVWWVPGNPAPITLPDGWEAWLRVDDAPLFPTPFQRHDLYLRAARATTLPAAHRSPRPPPVPQFSDRPAELSDLIVFDYLIGNLDRWGSENTNVRSLGDDKPMIFLDNANGFHVRPKPSPTLEARLTAVQRFRKSTVQAFRKLDVPHLERRMSADPLAPLLSERHLADLEKRRKRVLEHVADMQQRYGADATPW